VLIVALGTIAIYGLAFGQMKVGALGKRAKPSAPPAKIIVKAPESARPNLALVPRQLGTLCCDSFMTASKS
jgi:hypothetical protein